jgi:chromosome segregation ATPase
LHKEKATMRAESSAIEAELRRERDQAQEQISLFLDQTRNEKDALQTQEAKLSQSLAQTLEQLNRKEDECEAELERIKELQVEKESLTASVRELTAQIEQEAQTIARLEESQTEAEEMRQTLESNRDLISKLKTELQKSIDKIKAADASLGKLEQDKFILENRAC